MIVLAAVAPPLVLYGANQPFNTREVPAEYELGPTYTEADRTQVVAFLQQQRDHSDPFRVESFGSDARFRWGPGMPLWHLDGSNGNNPLLPDTVATFRAAFSRDSRSMRPFAKVDLSSPLLNLFSVRYVIGSRDDSPDEDIRDLDPAASPQQFPLVYSDAYRVFENRSVLPRALVVPAVRFVGRQSAALQLLRSGAVDPRQEVLLDASSAQLSKFSGDAVAGAIGSARYTADGPNRVHVYVTSPSGGVLVVFDLFWPGWFATVDGSPTEIARADFVFRAVPLSPGAHVVEMTYRPTSVTTGLALSVAGLGLVLLVLAGPRLLKRRQEPLARSLVRPSSQNAEPPHL